ncbi:mannitol dehydrogenase family protein [Microbacterium sp. YY-01]|uniref:mannitol dehydrogenase family protein n=1 Tax=Microbacterium sp. YY-01 TaxID=3421634 RepID=UPI003D16FAD2
MFVPTPQYDRSQLTIGIVHCGVGNFHRAHQAWYLDRLMNAGLAHDWAICGVGLMPTDAHMRDVMTTQDGLYTLVLKHPDGRLEPRVLGSIVDYLFAPDDPDAVLQRLTHPHTRIVSLTITEGGYNIDHTTGEFNLDNAGVQHDLAHPHSPTTVFGFVTEALQRRRAAGHAPFTVMSCDNMQGNGTVARRSFLAFAAARDSELASWMSTNVAFPNSMVDRITPATTQADRDLVHNRWQIPDAWPVTAEPFAQWVLEDTFPAGRPPYEDADVQVVADVEPYELMKLRLLNASHQAMAYFGTLMGYEYAHEAASDPLIRSLLQRYMHDEAMPTLEPVAGVDLNEYMATLLERFANPAVADTLTRLCTDASDRIPTFLLPVIRDCLDAGLPVTFAAAVVASWAHYCEGVTDMGEAITITDSRAADLQAAASESRNDPRAFVRQHDIFGDLGAQPDFADTFTAVLQTIRQAGARGALQQLVGT